MKNALSPVKLLLPLLATLCCIPAATAATAPSTLYLRYTLTEPLLRLRSGVIAEVGAGRPATVGRERLAAGTSYDSLPLDPSIAARGLVFVALTADNSLTIGFADPAPVLGQPFSSLFPSFDESALIKSLLSDTPLIETFLDSLAQNPNTLLPLDHSASLLHFSDATTLGTLEISTTPLPEPSTLALGTLALLTLLRPKPR